MASANVKNSNEAEVFAKRCGNAYTPEDPKFEEGDRVLISKYASPLVASGRKTFRKGYKVSFSKDVYKVSKVWRGDPNFFL